MSALLVALTAVMLLPLFLGSWRVSLVGLAAQGALLAAIGYRLHPDTAAPATWVLLVDLAVVRGLIAPLALRPVAVVTRQARHDIIPPNLLSWTLAVGMVLVAFRFADVVEPVAGDARMMVGVAATGVLLGLLVLSTQNGPLGQMIGVLRLENGIALFELGSGAEPAIGVHVAQLVVFVATLVLFRWYLHTLPVDAAAAAAPGEEAA